MSKKNKTLSRPSTHKRIRFSFFDASTEEPISGKIIFLNRSEIPILSLSVEGHLTTSVPKAVEDFIVESHGYVVSSKTDSTEKAETEEFPHHIFYFDKKTTSNRISENSSKNNSLQDKKSPAEGHEPLNATFSKPSEKNFIAQVSVKEEINNKLEPFFKEADIVSKTKSVPQVQKTTMVSPRKFTKEEQGESSKFPVSEKHLIYVPKFIRYTLGTRIFDMVINYKKIEEYYFD